MKSQISSKNLSRREFVRTTSLAAAALTAGAASSSTAAESVIPTAPHPLITPQDDYFDLSRGTPKPHTLTGKALIDARMTPETWRCEIVADPYTDDVVKEPANLTKSLTLDDGNALDLPALMELGKEHRVYFLKAIQCLNIGTPLGQGLWEGVPLREVLRLAGQVHNVRRIYYWGFHNNNPEQVFQSSLSYTEAMETPPGEFPPFLAYKLNGEPISLKRGGPVRLIVPWAHGFKDIKWVQRIIMTNDFRSNDTYANQNNDPESHLKTAAYIDKTEDKFSFGQPVFMSGIVMAGYSGLQRVEYWLHHVEPGAKPPLPQDEKMYGDARWIPCALEAPPADWRWIFPVGVSPKDVLGFDRKTGRPTTWPLRYSMITWSAALCDLRPGKYEFRIRAVDLNGYAQPEPRPNPHTGINAIEAHRFEVV